MDKKTTSIQRKWFTEGSWRESLPARPDRSTDISEFYRQYHRKKHLWDKAFEYFRETDLESIPPGKYQIMGDSLFAVVQEYDTRKEEETRYETHRKYADIQYLISGEEKIGLGSADKAEILVPYDAADDISFLGIPGNNYRQASQEVFFIFFPSDAHRPCVMIHAPGKVKKIVFKISIQ